MRRFFTGLLIVVGVGVFVALSAAIANAQSTPGYWAGNVSHMEPALQPEPATVAPRAAAFPPVVATRVAGGAATAPRAESSAPVTNQTQQALAFYGGQSARATLNAMPRRTPIQPATIAAAAQRGKPFQAVTSGPTVSPYLNLFREENDNSEGAPNYYAFVRPQMEQQAANLRQQREIQLLQRQLQQRATGAGPRRSGAYTPTGSAARFMDTAQFYSGWQR